MDEKEKKSALPADWAARLATELKPVRPAPERALAMREKLFQRIHAEARPAPGSAEHLTLRAGDGRRRT